MSLIKNFLAGQVTFRVQGLPLSCLNKLRTFQITQITTNADVTKFCAPLASAITIKRLLSNFEYQISENYNLFRGINFLLNHFVLVVAVLMASIIFCVADMGIYDIKVQSDDGSVVSAIYEHLGQLGIKKFTWKNKLNSFNLANDLVGTFDNVAHAHVRIAGNTLVIDLVTATNRTYKTKTNFYAQHDAVIKEIITYSGTALVTIGDVVKKGDLLVADAYPDSVVVIGEVAFESGDQITRLKIWII